MKDEQEDACFILHPSFFILLLGGGNPEPSPATLACPTGKGIGPGGGEGVETWRLRPKAAVPRPRESPDHKPSGRRKPKWYENPKGRKPREGSSPSSSTGRGRRNPVG